MPLAVEQKRHHHAGMVRREAALLRVGVKNGREVERLAHCVSDEVRQCTEGGEASPDPRPISERSWPSAK